MNVRDFREREMTWRMKDDLVQNSLFEYPGQGGKTLREKKGEPIEAGYADKFAGIDSLDALREIVIQCKECELRQSAKGVVFGEGNSKARIMLIGEAPGKTEDDTGKPFVGRAGHLLDIMLEANGFSREEVFITNIVKCRPPGNRMPSSEEVQACLPNLKAQIRAIKPDIIVLLGALSCQTLIDPSLRVTKDRGKWFEKDGIQYLVTFHPAAVLRDEQGKKHLMLEDMNSLRKKYEELVR